MVRPDPDSTSYQNRIQGCESGSVFRKRADLDPNRQIEKQTNRPSNIQTERRTGTHIYILYMYTYICNIDTLYISYICKRGCVSCKILRGGGKGVNDR